MMDIRTHAEILEARRDSIRRRIADGYYEQDGVIDVAAELIAAEIGLTRSGCGRTLGEGLPAGSGFDSFPPSGDGVGRESAQRLAVTEPMQMPPHVGGRLPEEAAEVAQAWEEFNDKSGAIVWMAVAIFVALCLGGLALI